MNKLLFGFSLLAVSLFSCKKKDQPTGPVAISDELSLHLVPKLNGQNYQLDQVITSTLGYRYYFTDIKIFGTEVKNGSTFLTDAFFYNFRENGTLLAKVSGDKLNFSELTLNIGVPNPLNHADPSLPAVTSALNIANAGDMHWGWNPGYIFVKLEGKVDTLDNGIDNFDHNFVFHLGMDPVFRTLNFSGLNWQSMGDKKYRTNLQLEVQSIFDKPGEELDLRVDNISHSANTEMVLSNLVVDKVKNAILKE